MKNPLQFPLVLLFLLISTISFGQVALEDFSTIPDSLKTKSNDELIGYIRAQLGKDDIQIQDDFILYTNAILERAIRENNAQNIMRANYYYCYVKESQGDYKSALNYMQKALDIAEKNNFGDKSLIFLYRKIGLMNFRIGNFEAALKNYVKELKIAKKLKEFDRELTLLRNIALLKLNTGDKKDSYRVLQLSLKIIDSLEKENYPKAVQERIGTMMALGKNYTAFGQLDKALKTYQDAFELSKEEFPKQSTLLKAGIGNVLTLQKKYTEAIPYLDTAEQLTDSLNIADLKPFIYLHKGNNFFGLKKYTQAIQELTKVDSIIKNSKYPPSELQACYPTLAKCYDALGDYKKSKENYEKYIALDAKNDNLKLDIVSTIYELYDIDFLEAQIEDLSEDAEKKEKSLSATKLIIIILIVLIIFLFAYFQYKARQNQKRFEALLNKSTSVKKLTPITKTEKIDRKKLIPEEKAAELLAKLEKLERQKVFLDQNCTIAWLAKKLGTNASYASIIINDYRQKKFPEYLSELRIDYATERLKEDSKFRSYTIKSIAKDVGYKSSEAFSKAFKKINGIYPSYFIKKLNEKAQNAA
ncbi:tetratricopeptide repeat protein [Kordia jejudonensis]|uniref:tetratricopeptide repeat protein n=1 Tax=Kordia jejudonensis TaxID=1348245 RepID=UPI00062963A3|nr:tetratricopeptide repeat protein [Kordia jejudonensis]